MELANGSPRLWFVIALFLLTPVITRAQPTTVPTAAGNSTSRGTLKTDRGDFPYKAQFWSDDGASSDPVGAQIISCIRLLQAATTPEQEAATYSARSQPVAMPSRQPPASTQPAPANTVGRPMPKLRITHLITAQDTDGRDTVYFARVEITETRYTPPEAVAAGFPKSLTTTRAILQPFLAVRGGVLMDLPAHESPIFEAISFGEWDRFGLPAPTMPAVGQPQRPTTRPSNVDPASPTETQEMLRLMQLLDPASRDRLYAQRRAMPQMTERQATLWLSDQARNVLAARPSTEPAKP